MYSEYFKNHFFNKKFKKSENEIEMVIDQPEGVQPKEFLAYLNVIYPLQGLISRKLFRGKFVKKFFSW